MVAGRVGSTCALVRTRLRNRRFGCMQAGKSCHTPSCMHPKIHWTTTPASAERAPVVQEGTAAQGVSVPEPLSHTPSFSGGGEAGKPPLRQPSWATRLSTGPLQLSPGVCARVLVRKRALQACACMGQK